MADRLFSPEAVQDVHGSTAERLVEVAEALRDGRDLAPGDRTVAARAIEALLAGKIETVRPGARSLATQVALEDRNAALRDAAARFFPAVTPSLAAEQLHASLKRHAGSAWHRERHLAECPARHHGRLGEATWRVLQATGGHVPAARTIRRILATSSPYSWPEPSANLHANRGPLTSQRA